MPTFIMLTRLNPEAVRSPRGPVARTCGAILHAALRFGEEDRNIVLEQESSLFQCFKHVIGAGLVFGFDAPDMTVDLVIGRCKSSELVIRFHQPFDQRHLIRELVSEFMGNVHGTPILSGNRIIRGCGGALRWIK